MIEMSRNISLLLALVISFSFISTNVIAKEVNVAKDISEDNWYYEAVNHVIHKGIMNLESNDKFNPAGNVELDTLYESLFRLENNLNNVDEELEKWIDEFELNQGLEVKNSKSINRGELAVVLYNYLNKHNIQVGDIELEDIAQDYIDIGEIPKWAEEAFKYLVKGNFIVGENERLTPNDNLNRGELAQVYKNISNIFAASTSGSISEISKYGNLTIDLYAQNLLNTGFEYGDMLKIKIGNIELEAPFTTDYSDVDNGSVVVRASDGIATSNIILAINMGNLAEKYNISEGDKVDFELLEKGGYLTEWKIHQLERSNNREDYDSDVIFANFRNVAVGDIADGVYYRSSSPINNDIGRAAYADKLAKKAEIATIINLADNKEEIEKYIADKDFNSPIYKELYDKNRVILLDMGVDFKAEDFKNKLKQGLEFLISNEGPYLVHCNEGKDRAGFVAGLLEALMGSTVEEIKEDYMITYINYYNVESGSEQYNSIAESNILESLRYISGLEKGEDLADVDLVKASEEYLLSVGISKEQIKKIKINLSKGLELLDDVA